jgi:hypothetical protein
VDKPAEAEEHGHGHHHGHANFEQAPIHVQAELRVDLGADVDPIIRCGINEIKR